MKELSILLNYNLRSEYRKLSQTIALVLFSWIVCYIIYRIHPDLAALDFGYTYWIFLMLISINICLRAESMHGSDEHLFLYTCVNPSFVFAAKLIFNFFYLFFIGVLFYFFYVIYFNVQIQFIPSFLIAIAAGSLAISSCLSFVSTMSSYADGQSTLISILALPLLIPVIMIMKNITDEIVLFDNWEYSAFITLLSITTITIALSILLFPFIWKE